MSDVSGTVSDYNDFLNSEHNRNEGLSYDEINSQLLSNTTADILKQIDDLRSKSSSGVFERSVSGIRREATIEELLFDARAEVKVLTSEVSMYLPPDFRRRLFNQIDLIHEPEDWDSDDEPVNKRSFMSFLRWYLVASPSTPPGFGLSSSGNLIAAWMLRKNKIILEFLPSDRVKWIVTRDVDGEAERASGVTKIKRLSEVLMPYGADDFFHMER